MAAATTAMAAIAATLFLLLSVSLNAQLPPVGSPKTSTVEVPVTAPSPGLDCMSYLLNMSDCLSYVIAGSNLTKPDKLCCPELAGLVDGQPICLCQLLGNHGSLGIDIDLKKAIKLPKVCKVTTPPVSLCSAIGVPVGVPTASKPTASLSPSPLKSKSKSKSPPPSLSPSPSPSPSPPPSPSLPPSPEGVTSSPSSINKGSYGVRNTEASLFGLLTIISIPFFF